jgi:hypothetical protein
VAGAPTLLETTSRILALPREAGTPAVEEARRIIADHLTHLGYQVQFQRFRFTPASLDAFPIFGAGLGGLALVILPSLSSGEVPRWLGLLMWAVGLAALTLVATGVGLGWVPLQRGTREDANLLATRPGSQPRRWIVAHLDSKAQGHSMAGRLVAVWVVAGAILILSLLASLRFLQGPLRPVWLMLGLAPAVLAGVLAGRGRLRGTSIGARDNASGVVAALVAAERSQDVGTGILITSAEEFGLVGGRVFARLTSNVQDMEFINLDTLDQEGTLYVVSHDAKGHRFGRELEGRLAALDLPIQHRRLPWGIFVDSAAFARAHARSVTLGRLTWATLRRIHTPDDTAQDLSLSTAEQIGKAIVSN